MADATNVGNVYLAIRADIKRLSSDLAQAEKAAKQGAEKIQAAVDKGVDFDRLKTAALGAAAGVYAAFRTMGQAIESSKIGSTLLKQSEAFDNLAAASGNSSKAMIASLKAASRGLVAESDLMSASGKALLMNIPADKISQLMEVAAATSRMTGQTITQAFDDITLGVARQSRLILDNLGIIVDVDSAYERYGKTINKTAQDLNEAEKRQAFMNAVLSAGSDMIKRLGDATGSLDGVNKLLASQTELWGEINKSVAMFLDGELTTYAKIVGWITDKLKEARQSAPSRAMESEASQIGMLESLSSKGLYSKDSVEARKRAFYLKYQGNDYGSLPGYKSSVRDPYTGMDRIGDNTVMYDPSKFDDYVKALDEKAKAEQKAADEEEKALKQSQDAVEKHVQAMQKAWMDMNKIEDQNSESRFVKKGGGWNAGPLNPYGGATIEEENQMREFRIKAWKEENDKYLSITQHTAEAVQDAWADLFFDAMTGKLKTLEDYFNAFYQSIAKMASQYLSQQAIGGIMGLFGNTGSPITAGDRFGAMFATNTPIAAGGVSHLGGVIGSGGVGMRSIPASYYSGAPRLHSGLMPDEYPAILQKGEAVIPKGGSMGGGGGNTYYISAMDTKSIVDALRRSGAVPMLSEENIRGNGSLRRAIQTRAR
jgi:hypothetical protein